MAQLTQVERLCDGDNEQPDASDRPARTRDSTMYARASDMYLCRLLERHPSLGERLSAAERDRAVAECIVPAISISRGDWPAHRMRALPDAIGLLVLDGLLIRRVGMAGRFGAELLGTEDLLRPWEGYDDSATVRAATTWRVATRVELVVLDDSAAARLARYPPVITAITGRAVQRAHRLAVMMAIIHHPRTEDRLLMVLWHLADRWGRVRRDGIHLPLRLSHSVLADLIATRRPSVTIALKRLRVRGSVQTLGDGWLLLGDPPRQLLELQPASRLARRSALDPVGFER